MRTYLTAGIVLGLLAGCSSNQDPAAAKAVAASAAGMSPASAGTAFTSRAPMSGLASLPDRGELIAYERNRQVRRSGAYSAYPVAISEAHALNAMRTGEMVINAPDGEPIRLTYERHEEGKDGNWTWIGRNAEGASAVITFGEKAVFGVIPQGATESLSLRTSAGQPWLVQTDRSKLAGMNGMPRRDAGDQLLPPAMAGAMTSQTASATTTSSIPVMANASASAAVVDVLLGYTPGFVTEIGSESGAVTRLVNMAAIANDAYSNSGVNMRIRLVKTLKVNYPDDTDNGDALQKLTGYEAGEDGGPIDPDPAFKELREMRDEVGADLVSLVRAFRTPQNNGCGIAWLIGSGKTGISPQDEPFGYSVVSDGNDKDEDDGYTYGCSQETLAHELGHNMGQAHNEEDSKDDDGNLSYGLHEYSFGYRESSSTGFYTVMSYPHEDGNQTGIRYFANPDIKYGGRPTGVANKSDNTRSMNQSMPVVAQFRDTVVPIEGQRPNIYVIKRIGSGSKTEVHTLGGESGYKSFIQHAATRLHRTGSGNDWAFRAGDYNGDGKVDIYAIKRNGSSGKTEVHVLNGADKFQTYLLQSATALHKTGTTRAWEFQLADYNGDGRLDLYVIKRNGSSGKVEVHVLNGADKFKSFLLHTATRMNATGTDPSIEYLVGNANSDGKPDVYVIKRNGGSGRTEVHVMSGADKFQSYVMQRATALAKTGAVNNWAFTLGDYDEDGTLDLYAIKRVGSSGKTEVHILDGGSKFGSYIKHTATELHQTGTSGAWQFVTN